MRNPKILIDFPRLKDPDFVTFAKTVSAAMTGNKYYLTPNPSIATLDGMITDFINAIAASENGGSAQEAVKDEVRESLNGMLTSLGNNITATANGNRVMLASTGFTLSKDDSTPKMLGPLKLFTVSLGKNTGEAVLAVKIKNAKAYMFEYCDGVATAASTWTSMISTKGTYTFTGLEAVKMYSFRVCISGSGGQSVYTEIVSKTIL